MHEKFINKFEKKIPAYGKTETYPENALKKYNN